MRDRGDGGPQDDRAGAAETEGGAAKTEVQGGVHKERRHQRSRGREAASGSHPRSAESTAHSGGAVDGSDDPSVDPLRDAQVFGLRELGAAALPLCGHFRAF